ncbi:MAG: BPL-N domain-containing protein [Candidatus Cardinium sp.]|uniref:BPL-N domain-containing protein n=1 Tax=Candidatus Cardinium sp. TP TaxID=2961955 RepID=UPI0021B064F4|nr:BPL-N domain-containing protein [Candidatus Cardinium sp. TP]MCT4696889.1 BPL-N domain-containing protein [Candidatus Cardinium sp. TP]MDN5246712.1 BPL-N domain-containing protein [Candidatus Cardinium sp.]
MLSVYIGAIQIDYNDKVIKIYNDIGVAQTSVQHCLYSLKLHIPPSYTVGYVSASAIIEGYGLEGVRLLILPGGRDLYYIQSLQGQGNKQIQDYLSGGGNFLGICAGSYYSGTYLVFAPGTPIEVIGSRALGLFQGVVKGPILAPYCYGSYKGASAARVLITTDAQACYLYYNGGGYFVDADKIDDTTVLARYQYGEAAIIQCKYGLGRVILSGVHIEYDPYMMRAPSLKSIRKTLKRYNRQRIKLLKHLLALLSIQ